MPERSKGLASRANGLVPSQVQILFPAVKKMIADLLSISRIVLGLLFVFVARNKNIALLIVLVAGLTDILDGFTARKYGKSKYGKYIDPIADRIFALLVVLSLIAYYDLNILYGTLILSRDIMNGLILPFLFIIKNKKPVIKVSVLGKLTTVLIFAALISTITNFYSGEIIFITIIISIFTAVHYLILNFS